MSPAIVNSLPRINDGSNGKTATNPLPARLLNKLSVDLIHRTNEARSIDTESESTKLATAVKFERVDRKNNAVAIER